MLRANKASGRIESRVTREVIATRTQNYWAPRKCVVPRMYMHNPNEVMTWDSQTGNPISSFKGSYFQSLAISPDGTRIAVGGMFEVMILDAEIESIVSESKQNLFYVETRTFFLERRSLRVSAACRSGSHMGAHSHPIPPGHVDPGLLSPSTPTSTAVLLLTSMDGWTIYSNELVT